MYSENIFVKAIICSFLSLILECNAMIHNLYSYSLYSRNAHINGAIFYNFIIINEHVINYNLNAMTYDKNSYQSMYILQAAILHVI